jgi:dTDP-4-amino-4,6-dideoxygalactose transaminase
MGEMTHPPDGPWYYQQLDLGFNFRMSDLHAALGTSQLKRLDEFVSIRHAIARRYDELLADFPVAVPPRYGDSYSGMHLYAIRLKLKELRTTRRAVVEHLHQVGIGVGVHYIPVYRQPFYERLGFTAGYCPDAEQYYEEVISLPIYPGLTVSDQETVVGALRDALTVPAGSDEQPY